MGRFAELREAVGRVERVGSWTPAAIRRIVAAELRAHGHADTAVVYLAEALEWYAARTPEEKLRLREEIALALYHAGRYDDARALYEVMLAEAPEPTDSPSRHRVLPLRARLGTLAARQGDIAEARRVEEWLRSLDWPYMYNAPTLWRARIAAALGEHDRAADLLRQGFYGEALRFGFGRWVHTDPDFVELRDHPGFQEGLRPRSGD